MSNEQLASYEKLRTHGFVSRNYVLEIERKVAETQSRQSEDLSNLAGITAQLAELRLRAAQREVEYRREVETQLSDVQKELATLAEKLAAQRDTVNRLAIKAPVRGAVVDLGVHTIGGVVKPGERIMDLLPIGDKLVVDAQVSPQYVDRLKVDLPADVHFDAYGSRLALPVLNGRVERVSADVLSDPRTGAPYYTMRVAVPSREIPKLGQFKLQPGMQATVVVKTGERSLLSYLLRPLSQRLATSMKE